MKFLKIQRRLFRDADRELTKDDYQRLLNTAHKLGKGTAGTSGGDHWSHRHPGQRSSVYHRRSCPTGQSRNRSQRQDPHHPAPRKTPSQAAEVCEKTKTASGAIFRTKSGKELGRRQIWAELKGLCKHAGVEPGKVFSLTICGTCLPLSSTEPAGTLPNWLTCWATAASKPHASTGYLRHRAPEGD